MEEAPIDNRNYARQNSSWVEVLDAPNDGKAYGRKNASWVEVSVPPLPPPVITSTHPMSLYYYYTWDQVQFNGQNFKDTDILVIEGVDHTIAFVYPTTIRSTSTSQVGGNPRTIPIYVRALDGQVSNTVNMNVSPMPL